MQLDSNIEYLNLSLIINYIILLLSLDYYHFILYIYYLSFIYIISKYINYKLNLEKFSKILIIYIMIINYSALGSTFCHYVISIFFNN